MYIQKVLETEEKQTEEIKLLKKNRYSFYTQFETININDKNGNFKEFQINITDITAKKKLS